MSFIQADPRIVTQINVFTTTRENQQALIELLAEAARHVQDVPGWISANIHRERDGTRVVNYAQCASREAWEAVMAKLRAGGFLDRNKLLGQAAPGLYEVVFTLEK